MILREYAAPLPMVNATAICHVVDQYVVFLESIVVHVGLTQWQLTDRLRPPRARWQTKRVPY